MYRGWAVYVLWGYVGLPGVFATVAGVRGVVWAEFLFRRAGLSVDGWRYLLVGKEMIQITIPALFPVGIWFVVLLVLVGYSMIKWLWSMVF